MKNTVLLLLVVSLISCSTKKTETAQSTTDSVAVDSVLTTTSSHTLLAFNPVGGFSSAHKLVLTDTVNYFLFPSAEELKAKFGSTGATSSTDFLINFVLAVACKPTTLQTTIALDRVEIGPESIDVYVTLQRGEPQKTLSTPAQVFVIEKRDGYSQMRFYVNGKKDKALMLDLGE